MVVRALTHETVDQLFHALADATRRDIVSRSVGGELSVSRLAEFYPMSFAAVQRWWGPPTHPATMEHHDLTPRRLRHLLHDRSGWREAPRLVASHVRLQLAEHDSGTRMEVRSVFSSLEHKEELVRMGAIEIFVQTVSQMDDVLAG